MKIRNCILSLIFISSLFFSVFALTGCEISEGVEENSAGEVLDNGADTSIVSEEETPADMETSESLLSLFGGDKGYANSSIGLTAAEFKNVWEMANLTARVYHDLWDSALMAISPTIIPTLDFAGNTSRYTVVQTYNGNMGFAAELFRNIDTNKYVLVFRGTNPLSVTDWVTNLQQALTTYINIPVSQYDAAVNLARNVKAQYPNLQIAGHSLGGGLAQLAALDTGVKATCFNAAGLTSATLSRYGITTTKLNANKVNINHYNVKYDPLTDMWGYMDSKAPFSNTLQYGGRTRWLRNIYGTGFTINPLRIVNHFYHAYVYQLKYTYSDSGNFL